jgi:hypothetical protein
MSKNVYWIQGSAVGCREYGDKPSGTIKVRNFYETYLLRWGNGEYRHNNAVTLNTTKVKFGLQFHIALDLMT